MSISGHGATRICAASGAVIAAAVGLISRMSWLNQIPILPVYAGDACWAMAAYAVIRLIVPEGSIARVAIAAILAAWIVELTQLIRFQWLDEARAETMLGLLIGRGFVWSDLLVYVVGVGFAAMIEWMIRRGGRTEAA